MTFGTRLKELRLARRMNQRDLADKADIDVTYLSKIENGRMEPPAEDTIQRLASILGADADELLVLAKKVPSDVRDVVTASPEVPAFLRKARNLKAEDWRALRKKLEDGQTNFLEMLK